ncbi:MAG: hypothetical protein DSZ04_03950 [Sulfurimonas sp.]|nr:MAG: hypothetical protein DSZ04_03950 [Sulfurimonas sp.]
MGNRIKEIEDGPLILEMDKPLLVKDEELILRESTVYLCRCGDSFKKPFCDGTHKKNGFTSKREISKELLEDYEGKDITIHFNRSICAGAFSCVKGSPSVFLSGERKDWIKPDRGNGENIINTINNCPSGALSYSINDEVHIDKREFPKVTVLKDGPYNVEGVSCEHKDLPNNFCESKYTLCRCGFSKNKPYCDYSHALNKWSDE